MLCKKKEKRKAQLKENRSALGGTKRTSTRATVSGAASRSAHAALCPPSTPTTSAYGLELHIASLWCHVISICGRFVLLLLLLLLCGVRMDCDVASRLCDAHERCYRVGHQCGAVRHWYHQHCDQRRCCTAALLAAVLVFRRHVTRHRLLFFFFCFFFCFLLIFFISTLHVTINQSARIITRCSKATPTAAGANFRNGETVRAKGTLEAVNFRALSDAVIG